MKTWELKKWFNLGYKYGDTINLKIIKININLMLCCVNIGRGGATHESEYQS